MRCSVQYGRSMSARVVPYLSIAADGSHSARPGGSSPIVFMIEAYSG